MTTKGGDLRKSRFDLPSATLLAIAALTIFLLLVSARVVGQQNSSDTASNRQSSSGAVEAPNPDTQSGHNSQEPNLPNAPSPAATYKPTSELTRGDRFTIYRQTVLRPYSVVGPALGAAIGQAENEPPEWGQGAEGYGKRIASGMARQMISETIRFGFAAVDGEDPRYHRSEDTGFWPRAQHAVVETFTSETASGRRIPAFSRFAGTYGAAFIANSWYPESRATTGYALRRGSTALASSVGFHLFQEFMPRKYFKRLGLGDETLPSK